MADKLRGNFNPACIQEIMNSISKPQIRWSDYDAFQNAIFLLTELICGESKAFENTPPFYFDFARDSTQAVIVEKEIKIDDGLEMLFCFKPKESTECPQTLIQLCNTNEINTIEIGILKDTMYGKVQCGIFEEKNKFIELKKEWVNVAVRIKHQRLCVYINSALFLSFDTGLKGSYNRIIVGASVDGPSLTNTINPANAQIAQILVYKIGDDYKFDAIMEIYRYRAILDDYLVFGDEESTRKCLVTLHKNSKQLMAQMDNLGVKITLQLFISARYYMDPSILKKAPGCHPKNGNYSSSFYLQVPKQSSSPIKELVDIGGLSKFIPKFYCMVDASLNRRNGSTTPQLQMYAL